MSLVPVFLINRKYTLSAFKSAKVSCVKVLADPAASFGPFVWSPEAPTKSVLLSDAPSPNNSSSLAPKTITFGA